MRSVLRVLTVVALVAEPARAQLGELQTGIVGAYGTSHAYGPGAGLTLAVNPARLASVGLRWTYYFGVPEQRGATATEVHTKAQVIAVDLGVLIPAGAVEINPGMSLGWNQFTQSASQPSSTGSSQEFFAAPGVAVEWRVAGLALIPQLQYAFAGSPNLPWSIEHQSLMLSVRCVVLGEMKRIRR